MKKTVKKKRGKPAITYKNKDVTSKILAERFKNDFFNEFGLNLPPIIDVRPTNLPAVEANELQLDNLFCLQDGSYAIVDYESAYSEKNKFKYLGYVDRLAVKLYNELEKVPRLRVIVLYTADIKRGDTNPILDLGDNVLHITEVFLSELDVISVIERVESKLARREEITDQDAFRLILSPLAVNDDVGKKEMIRKVINLASEIQDKDTYIFVLKGLFVFTDKVITKEDSDRIRRMLDMTKVEQIFWEEKEKAVKDAKIEIAINMLKAGDSPKKVAACTGIRLSRIEKLASKIEVEV